MRKVSDTAVIRFAIGAGMIVGGAVDLLVAEPWTVVVFGVTAIAVAVVFEVVRIRRAEGW